MTFGELPCLADWAEYAMALYEHWGWGQQTFVKDWAEVEGRQVQGAVEGSPVAQAIIGLMREHDSYKKSSSGLLEKLEAAADRLNIDVKREKRWPKSPSWLWRRIQEIKPALAAHTIYAERGEDNSGSYILLTKGAPPEDDGGGSRNGSGSISRYAATDAATVDPAYTAEHGGSGSSGSKNGHLSPSSLVPIEENGHVEHESGPKEHSPREVPENAATAAILPLADDDEYVDGPAAIDVEGEDWTYMPGDDVEFDESRYITDQAGLDRVREELDLSPAPAEPELPPLPEGENPDDWFAIQYFAGENSRAWWARKPRKIDADDEEVIDM
jgi:hypothetical protein